MINATVAATKTVYIISNKAMDNRITYAKRISRLWLGNAASSATTNAAAMTIWVVASIVSCPEEKPEPQHLSSKKIGQR